MLQKTKTTKINKQTNSPLQPVVRLYVLGVQSEKRFLGHKTKKIEE